MDDEGVAVCLELSLLEFAARVEGRFCGVAFGIAQPDLVKFVHDNRVPQGAGTPTPPMLRVRSFADEFLA